jgi:hypothetical protein
MLGRTCIKGGSHRGHMHGKKYVLEKVLMITALPMYYLHPFLFDIRSNYFGQFLVVMAV